jgi:plastocyanin
LTLGDARRGLGFALSAAALLTLPAAAQAPAKTHVIELRDLAFMPATMKAEVGDTVTWVNADIFRHSATAEDHSFDVDLVPGARGDAVLGKPGVIRFICRYHPDMKGQIVVRPKARR